MALVCLIQASAYAIYVLRSIEVERRAICTYPPLGVEVISEFQEFQESFKSLKLHKVFSKDEDASRKSKDGKCSIVVHLFCFELNLLMLNRFCSSNV